MMMTIEELASAYADAVVHHKYAQIDKKALRSTSSAQEVLAATTGLLNAKKAILSSRKELLKEACKGVKERLGWLDKVDPNQIPLPLHTGRALNTDYESAIEESK